MALPVYQAAGASAETAGAAGTAVNPAWPAHQAGDIGLLIVESEGYGLNIPTPNGFKELISSPQISGAANDQGTQLNVFWKRATSGAESAPTVKNGSRANGFGGTDDLALKAKIVTFRGCAPTGNPWNVTKGSDVYDTAGTAVTIPGATTTDNDCLVVLIVSWAGDLSTAQVSGWTNASLANLTERFDDASGIGFGTGVALATGEKAAAGAVSATTATLATSVTHSQIMIALTPVATADDTAPYLFTVGTPQTLAAAGNITPAWPEGHQADDIGILTVLSGGWPVTTPTGWTAFASSPQLGGVSGAADATGLHMYWKRATSGAEAAPSIAFVAAQIQGCIAVIRGCPNTGNPIHAEAGSTSANSTAVSLPGVTTTKPNAFIFQVMGHTLNSNSRGSNSASFSNSNLDEFNRDMVYPKAIGSGTNLNFYKGKKKVAGSIGNTTGTLDFTQRQSAITAAFTLNQLVLPIDTGAFTFTGQAVNLLGVGVIPMNTGVFTLTGQDVNFSIVQNKLLTMEPGVYSLQGQAINFTIKRGKWEKKGRQSGLWTKKPPVN